MDFLEGLILVGIAAYVISGKEGVGRFKKLIKSYAVGYFWSMVVLAVIVLLLLYWGGNLPI